MDDHNYALKSGGGQPANPSTTTSRSNNNSKTAATVGLTASTCGKPLSSANSSGNSSSSLVPQNCKTAVNSGTIKNGQGQKSGTKKPSAASIRKIVWACPQKDCGKVLKRRDHYITHMRRHLDIKPYKCHWPGCFFRGYDKFGSRKHVRQTHYRRSFRTKQEIYQHKAEIFITVNNELLEKELPSPKGAGALDGKKESKPKK